MITRRNDGFVLVSVLWILAILTVISLGFAHRAMLERRMAWYALDRDQAQQMARAAAERGLFELQNKQVLDAYNNQVGYTGLDQRWAQPIDLIAEGLLTKTAEGDTCEVHIQDSQSRIGLNGAPREVLENIKGINKRTISALLKLRDPSTPYYQQTFLHSVEELRSMEDFSEKEWYGTKRRPGLVNVLGISGSGRVNLNTASAEVLASLPNLEPEVAGRIAAVRNGPDGQPGTRDDTPYPSVGLAGGMLNISAEKLAPLNRFCNTDSRFFTIYAHASRRGGKINAYCTVTVELRGAVPTVLSWREGAGGA